MKRHRIFGLGALAVALLLAATACDNSGEADLTTTSTIVGSTTAPGDGTSSTTRPDDGSSTTLTGQPVTSSEIILRESTDEGETLYILIPPGAYTDVDLENFIGDLVESDETVENAEVFDDADALQAFLLEADQQTATDLVLIDEHHLVSLIDRSRIRFQGPFAEFGEYSIGS